MQNLEAKEKLRNKGAHSTRKNPRNADGLNIHKVVRAQLWKMRIETENTKHMRQGAGKTRQGVTKHENTHTGGKLRTGHGKHREG